jgi:hypothetical protein
MACTKCKNKETFKEQMNKATSGIEKSAIAFIIVWTMLGLYGIYSLIVKFL